MKKFPVGVQVYSVREEAAADFAGTMKKIKEIGYDGVELAGLYGIPAAEIKKILDEVGIPAISAHVPVAEMMEDAQKVISDYSTIGVKCIVVPYLPEEQRYGTDKYSEVLDIIKKMGALCKEAGIILLYHNHDFEFDKNENGDYPLDLLYEEIPADLLQTELDCCWVNVSGVDTPAYIRKYTGRAPIVHLKDYVGEKSDSMYELIGIDKKADTEGSKFEFRAVGDGKQDWPSILEAATDAGAEWVVVEQDQHYGYTPLEDIERSRNYLKTLGL